MTTFQRIDDIVAGNAIRHADRPALRDGERAISYRELEADVERASASLLALGAGPGDRVLVVAENDARALVLLFAICRIGAWPVLATARLGPLEIDAIAAHCEPRLAIHLTSTSDAAAGHAGRRSARAVDVDPLGSVAVERLAGDPAPEPPPGRPGDGVAALLYTSGTTGAPKAAMLSHANVLFIARTQGELRRYAPDDRVWCAVPIAYAGAIASITMSTLLAGGCLHLARRFAPEALARALREDGITVVPGVPALHARFAAWVRAHPHAYAAPRLRMATSAASPLDVAVKADVEAVYGLPLQNGYGLTETTAVVCQTSLDGWRRDTSVGRPLPGVETRVVDPSGRGVPCGEVGEILVRGPNVFAGYYRDPEATRAALTGDGWFRTGDLGCVDARGDLAIAGRAKELIKVSGYTVHPADVEAVFHAHPAVATCAVVARAQGADERIVAFVVLKDGASATPRALRAFVAERIADHKRPRVVRVLAELPALANGKVDRNALRRIALEPAPR